MALSLNTAWEVRTGGDDTNNSGGFVAGATGTDYSQQDAVQFSGTDLVIDASLNTKVTSASHNFVATDVGNILRVKSGTGFTAQFFQILSVASNAATLDRAVGTTSSTGGVWAVGGGFATLSKALAQMDLNNFPNQALATKVWMKSGTYTITSVMTLPVADTINVQGYQTTHGDDTGTKPLITTATNSTKLITGIIANNQRGFKCTNINFSNTAGTRDVAIYPSSSNYSGGFFFDKCVFDGFTIAIDGPFSGGYYFSALVLNRCEVKNCTSHGIRHAGSTYLIGTYIHDNTGSGFDFATGDGSNQMAVVDSCLFSTNGVHGIKYDNGNKTGLICKNSIFYSNTTDGVLLNAGYQTVLFVNNIFYGNGGYGIEGPTTIGVIVRINNAFRSNTLAATTNLPVDSSDIALTASPFTNVATPDFSLNSTAGGGAACKAVGFPGVIPFGTSISLDIGALQSAGSGGGGSSGMLFIPNLEGN